MANSLAESIANACAVFVVSCVSVRKGFIFSFIIAIVSSFCLLMARSIPDLEMAVPAFVLLDKGSVTLCFAFLYIAPINFFESRYLGLVMGVINFAARGSTIFAPMMAESGDKVPMACVIVLCALAAVGTCGLKMKDADSDDMEVKQKEGGQPE